MPPVQDSVAFVGKCGAGALEDDSSVERPDLVIEDEAHRPIVDPEGAAVADLAAPGAKGQVVEEPLQPFNEVGHRSIGA